MAYHAYDSGVVRSILLIDPGNSWKGMTECSQGADDKEISASNCIHRVVLYLLVAQPMGL